MAEHGGNGVAESAGVAQDGGAVSDDPLIGKVLDGRYRIERVLGEGGMGLVYKAVHTALNKSLAIKVLRPEVSKNEQIVARFKQEAQSASAIGNQHIIDISDFGVLPDGSTYFVMEFLTGQSLTEALEAGRLDSPRAIRIAKQLCKALGAAHDIGVVHRDMKPDNVQLIERGGDSDFVKVLDFGIAKVGGSTSKLTQAGQVFGTPHYMSPEQCAGTAVDHRTDIYAVGVILYEMSTGQVPFDADNLMGILTKHLYENPIPPHDLPPPVDVPPTLEAVILKCLNKKPELRYQSMAEMAEDLEAIEGGLTPKAVVDQVERSTLSAATVADMDAPGRITVGMGQPAIPKRSLGPILALGVGAVALGVAAAFMMTKEEEPAPDAHVATPATPPAGSNGTDNPQGTGAGKETKSAEDEATATAETEQAPEAPPPAEVTISSVPAGAELYQGSDLLGNTPLAVAKPAGDEKMHLALRLAGYKEKSFVITARTGDSLRLGMTKSKPHRSARPRTTSRTKTGEKAASKEQKNTGPRRVQTEVLDPWD